eukprot:gene11314-3351_t
MALQEIGRRVRAGVGGACVALAAGNLVASAAPVHGSSMMVRRLERMGAGVGVKMMPVAPTLNPNANFPVPSQKDWVLVNKTVRLYSAYKRGDVVIMRSPTDPSGRIVKRIVAKEFDVIRTRGNHPHHVTIPAGHVWIEGDHSASSVDSSSFGAQSESLIEGRVVAVIWPPSRWKVVEPMPKTERLVHTHIAKI